MNEIQNINFVTKYQFSEDSLFQSFLGLSLCIVLNNSDVYSEPCQTSKMEHFAKIVNG